MLHVSLPSDDLSAEEHVTRLFILINDEKEFKGGEDCAVVV